MWRQHKGIVVAAVSQGPIGSASPWGLWQKIGGGRARGALDAMAPTGSSLAAMAGWGQVAAAWQVMAEQLAAALLLPLCELRE